MVAVGIVADASAKRASGRVRVILIEPGDKIQDNKLKVVGVTFSCQSVRQ
jgi:hypothetical protein